MKKVGLFGGTFDPPHIGHFIIAQAVKESLHLDEIWFIPTNEPPHKTPAFFSAEDRYQMVKSVTDRTDGFTVQAIELNRDGKSYTIDTIRALQKEYADIQFYFIIGGDMVAYLPHWYNIEALSELVTFVGVNRGDYQETAIFPVEKVDAPVIDISSTDIRDRLKKGKDIKFYLPHEVYLYMKEHLLHEGNGSE